MFLDIKKQLEKKEKEIEHWHNLYQERNRQFQSVRQRYHLLNRLQSNYDKKDKLHLSEMQCLELIEENKKLQQQLHSQPAEIVEKINGEIYTRMVVECKETNFADISLILDSVFEKYQK